MRNHNKKVENILRNYGLRCTQVRVLILNEFLEGKRPLSIQDFKRKKKFQSWDESSTYRNFSKLEEAGLIRAIPTNSEFQHYEVTLGPDQHHHHHITCTQCDSVQCLDICSVERQLKKMASSVHYQIQGHSLDLYGLCPACQKEES